MCREAAPKPIRPGTLAFVLAPALLLFCIGALTAIDVPGIYMDAITPDYLVVRLLRTEPPLPEVWSMPGQLLLGRFPLLFQLYHGALPFYLGLPAYLLLGTGIPGIRVANALFGCLVLAGLSVMLAAFRIRPAVASLCLALLALDPGFVFAFRTQLSITMLAGAPLLLSAALAEAPGARPDSAKRAGVAGLLAGIACYGYFIYFFLAPAAAIHAAFRLRRPMAWLAGFALGIAPYPLGVLLLATNLGPSHAGAYLHEYFGTLHVGSAALGLAERLNLFGLLVGRSLLDVGPSAMMLGQALPPALPHAKLVILLASAAVAGGVLLLPSLRARAMTDARGLSLLAGSLAGLLALVLVFGDRLWLHHAAIELPLAYGGLAFALDTGLRLLPRPAALAVAAAALAPLAAGNAIDRLAVFRQLDATGGRGLSSDALTRFAQDSTHDPARALYFFPDWGVTASFAMLTGGDLRYVIAFNPLIGQRALCEGNDAVLATVATAPPERLAAWIEAMGWTPPEQAIYRERQGAPVLIVTRWRATPRPATDPCPARP